MCPASVNVVGPVLCGVLLCCVSWSSAVFPGWPAGPFLVLYGALLDYVSWSFAVCSPAGNHVPGPVVCGTAGLQVLLLCRVVPSWPACPGPVPSGALLACVSWSIAVSFPAGLHVLSCELLSCVGLSVLVQFCVVPCWHSCFVMDPARLHDLVLCCVVPCWPACLGPVLCGAQLASIFLVLCR